MVGHTLARSVGATLVGVISGFTLLAQARPPSTVAHGDVTITAWMHASVQIEHAGTVIQVDPWSRGIPTQAKRADLILITDADTGEHHLDPKAIARVRKPGAPVIVPAIGKEKVPDGTVLANGQRGTFAGIAVEAVGAYDLTPGEPYHPKGEANGYVVTLGRSRVYIAGVTECVPEMVALRDVDVAFMPMNLPLGRMAPPALASCVRRFKPTIVYPYHFDQEYVRRVSGRGASSSAGPSIPDTITALREALKDSGIELRLADWYPPAK